MTTKTTTREITKDSTMEQILKAYPGAQRALFRRYHIGGCSSCGFQPTDRLEDVLVNHNILEVAEVIDHIKQAEELDRRYEVEPKLVAEFLKRGEIKLLDVRTEEESELARIKGAQLLTEELAYEIKSRWPKDSQIVFYCHHGIRSPDAAAYFIGHGFTNVRNMKGGIDAWSLEVDSSVPRYR